MFYSDTIILLVVGGLFVILGLVALIWGKTEEKRYYNSLSDRADLREFVNHWPQRPEHGAWKVGGWIALAIGLLLLIAGGIFWLWG